MFVKMFYHLILVAAGTSRVQQWESDYSKKIQNILSYAK